MSSPSFALEYIQIAGRRPRTLTLATPPSNVAGTLDVPPHVIFGSKKELCRGQEVFTVPTPPCPSELGQQVLAPLQEFGRLCV